MEFKVEATTVIWCACEHCGAPGPRRITLIQGYREYTMSVPESCCRVRPHFPLLSREE
jgi:hypothetical protein